MAVTAWVNHRGLSRLVPSLRAFRARGTAEIILGIDEGGATEQGLRLAANEFDRASVFFTTEERTFHPKLYLATGAAKGHLFVGSNNLTPGGLFFNFEAALVINTDLSPGGPPQGREIIAAAESYISRLEDDTDVCQPLGPNLEDIIRDGIYRVRDEAAPRPRQGATVIDPDADRDAFVRPVLFGRSSRQLKPRVPPGDPIPPSSLSGITGAPGGGTRTRFTGVSSTPGGTAVVGGPAPQVLRRWFRPLDATAAQHPPNVNSSPTGNIRLTQAGRDRGIDQTSYFRTEFFPGVTWTPSTEPRGTLEKTVIEMEVVIDGRSLGTHEFQISHASWREEDQGNVTTVLHVGPIAAELRATNYAGRVMTLEALASGRYRLVIDTTETGAFLR